MLAKQKNWVTMESQQRMVRELSVVIPTYNESENLPLLLDKLDKVLAAINYEVVIVDDDSPDQTWHIASQLGNVNDRIKVIRRRDMKGLSSAVVTGMHAATGSVIAVMDADMQHDEAILPEMYRLVANGECDICVGSREALGGSYGDWSFSRKIVSFFAKGLAHISLGSSVKDPMSGFFAISSAYFNIAAEKINPSGFKILLEFIARGKAPKVREVGYAFRKRIHGETKLTVGIAIEYLLALIDLKLGWLIPHGFVKFGMVGVTGSLVNFFGFAAAQGLGASIPVCVVIGVQLAILWTYFGNNIFTFASFRYRGLSYFKGLILYQIVSMYGLVIQLSVVDSILSNWPKLSFSLWSLYLVYMVGVCFAAVGNYFLHVHYTWNKLGFELQKPTKTHHLESHVKNHHQSNRVSD